jgi:glutamate-1-semialdehyde 2,1-aminomutase
MHRRGRGPAPGAGFFRLAGIYQQRFAASRGPDRRSPITVSDLQFTSAYRVPFQFSRHCVRST